MTLPGLMAMVLVSKEVAISGARDEHGEMTTIEAGETPFAVEALGDHVRFQGLRFVRPKRYAIVVYAGSGLAIEASTIEGLEPLPPPDNPTRITWESGINVIP